MDFIMKFVLMSIGRLVSESLACFASATFLPNSVSIVLLSFVSLIRAFFVPPLGSLTPALFGLAKNPLNSKKWRPHKVKNKSSPEHNDFGYESKFFSIPIPQRQTTLAASPSKWNVPKISGRNLIDRCN